jgi:hypothetical protein
VRIVAIILYCLTLAAACYGQTRLPRADEEILRALMPNGVWPEMDNLKRFKRTDEVRALKAAQGKATGQRATSIIWLLAALKYRYAENQRKLVNIQKNCHRQPYPHAGECYSYMADTLIDLFNRGDNSLLKYLFDTWRHSDGFLSEVLGGFYSDTLASKPRVFLTVMRARSMEEQKAISSAAGYEDGGGMNRERLLTVRRILRRAINKNDSLSKVAALCLKQIDLAHKQSELERARQH